MLVSPLERGRGREPYGRPSAWYSGSHRFEWQRRNSDGSECSLEVTLTPVALNGKHVLLSVWNDLTESKREVSRATRYETPLSLFLLDVGHFKQYNDTYGHPAGDTDLVARYGGEEFVLILSQRDTKGAMAFAERLRILMEICVWSLRTVTASFGVASLQHGQESGMQLIACADRALYQSKTKGRTIEPR